MFIDEKYLKELKDIVVRYKCIDKNISTIEKEIKGLEDELYNSNVLLIKLKKEEDEFSKHLEKKYNMDKNIIYSNLLGI